MRAWKNEPARTVGLSRVRLRAVTYGAATILRENGGAGEIAAEPQAGEELEPSAFGFGLEWWSRLYGREVGVGEVVKRIIPWSRVLEYTSRTALVLEERSLGESENLADEEGLRRNDRDSEEWGLIWPWARVEAARSSYEGAIRREKEEAAG